MDNKLLIGLVIAAGAGVYFLTRKASAEEVPAAPGGPTGRPQAMTASDAGGGGGAAMNPASPGGGATPTTSSSSDMTAATQQPGAVKSMSSRNTASDLTAQTRKADNTMARTKIAMEQLARARKEDCSKMNIYARPAWEMRNKVRAAQGPRMLQPGVSRMVDRGLRPGLPGAPAQSGKQPARNTPGGKSKTFNTKLFGWY